MSISRVAGSLAAVTTVSRGSGAGSNRCAARLFPIAGRCAHRRRLGSALAVTTLPVTTTRARPRRSGRRCRRGSSSRRLGIELFFVVFFDGTSSHHRGANPFFHDVLLFVLVEGSLHAFDVDWF
jgi:hypothetical protein